jgi:dipeptidyl aminopeptidase/acylaminoacyl peptidase
MNGADDPQVKPYHALKLALRLSELKKTYQLKIVDGGNHILSGAATDDTDQEIIEWFKKYIR